MSPRPPTPVCKTFLVCKQIFVDELTQECTLVAPIHQIFVEEYPLRQYLSFFARWTKAHGSYRVEVQLRDLEGAVLWRDEMAQPLQASDPLRVVPLSLSRCRVRIPEPGTYEFVLLANGQEVSADVFLAHRCAPDPA
jgi:hypothetical protein